MTGHTTGHGVMRQAESLRIGTTHLSSDSVRHQTRVDTADCRSADRGGPSPARLTRRAPTRKQRRRRGEHGLDEKGQLAFRAGRAFPLGVGVGAGVGVLPLRAVQRPSATRNLLFSVTHGRWKAGL